VLISGDTFFKDDVDAFRQFVADATNTSAVSSRSGVSSNISHKIGSPTATSSLPTPSPKSQKSLGGPQYGARSQEGKARGQPAAITRADINSKDGFGRTLLHHAASSCKPNALEFVTPLLGVPFLDLYAPRLAEPSEIHLASSSFRFVPDLVWMVLEYELAIFTTDSEYICVLLHS
jgi:hypothetical protein